MGFILLEEDLCRDEVDVSCKLFWVAVSCNCFEWPAWAVCIVLLVSYCFTDGMYVGPSYCYISIGLILLGPCHCGRTGARMGVRLCAQSACGGCMRDARECRIRPNSSAETMPNSAESAEPQNISAFSAALWGQLWGHNMPMFFLVFVF